MYSISKTKKSFIGVIAMSLILLMGSALGLLIETRVGQITKPSSSTWANYTTKPSGSASESSPWVITSASELAYLIDHISDGTYYIELQSDIDLLGYFWTPIKSYRKNAKINFNGNGHNIANMKIDLPNENQVGFFEGITYDYDAYLNFENVTFSNVNVRGKNDTGTICGYMANGTIRNVIVKSGSVVADRVVGGLTSMNWGVVYDCVNNADVFSFGACAGGIKAWGGDIYNCVNTGTITGGGDRSQGSTNGWIGGITAYGGRGSGQNAGIHNCLSMGDIVVRGTNVGVGGVTARGEIENSGFYGSIYLESSVQGVGSISCEENSWTIKNCFGIADIYLHDTSIDEALIYPFGIDDKEALTNCYSYIQIHSTTGNTEYRKYVGDDFSGFAYNENINGGFPFPKELFAIGQFLEEDVLAYLQSNGFSSI